ncbi:Hypothetical predicted protein [Paramuricea clavata]|uniref:Uncharacterized protein n=1 Tax=Paramuricea clavata TaxID=317549 RepID=A0A6S7IYU8_PARCT|nr:Hypothetical predicted protein [Paramuricea clavata]
MALVDHEYRFICIDVGSYGSNSDGGIFAKSELGKALDNNQLHIPPDKHLPGALHLGNMPHVIVGDEAFPLKRHIMRPYPGSDLDDNKRIYNYRLSRARRIVENAFGILAARWRIYQRRIQLHPKNVDKIIKATCVLHNYLQKTSSSAANSEEIGYETRAAAIQALRLSGNRASREAIEIREKFTNYFTSPAGEVLWQRNACFGQAHD